MLQAGSARIAGRAGVTRLAVRDALIVVRP